MRQGIWERRPLAKATWTPQFYPSLQIPSGWKVLPTQRRPDSSLPEWTPPKPKCDSSEKVQQKVMRPMRKTEEGVQ
ncbi:uncharacterized protein Z519_08955 [Cladophialophora bantiana CBS 173.52]|uniref:Uncharacterized protein n=1 Tax=Cladophialophora bantiana (strain ATCC 10958 / CBS 173.52 / CDC B-1940 / NIH 8579) TaxID=1442370 RepID=A0A0D2EJX1_CLAB1|nr:uncharacterized protein Z519_08955 [Cladophialophora bantiana CBS 173.52]KIW90311.1 hypothetical protein Z519_08955 [Cladophialophora bantiana CBS 173.52]